MEIFIGALVFGGTFVIGEQSVSALILMALTPLTSRKINAEKLSSAKLFKANNLFFALSVLLLLAINYSIKNTPFSELWLPLSVGSVIVLHGVVFLLGNYERR